MTRDDHPVYYRPNPRPIGLELGPPPETPEHDTDCAVHRYCACPCECHEDESYHPEDRYVEEVYDAG